MIHSAKSAVRRGSRRTILALERLESRNMLSLINWTNRGFSSDRFDSTFGAEADLARGVIDAAIEAWERVILDFNQPGGGNTINVSISMESSGTGFGATATVTSHTTGYPTAGSLRLHRGNDTNGDGNGDGDGYFLDPTPSDHSEFAGSILHAFTGNAKSGGPAIGKSDLFTLAVHELTHILGIVPLSTLKIHNPLAGTVTDTGIADDSEGGGIGRYFVFDGPSVTHLMTSNNGGSEGEDANRIVHSAGPDVGAANQPVTFESAHRGTLELVGVQDIINPVYEFGRRYLPTDYLTLMFQDAFGYEITLPQNFGTFYAMLNDSTGELLIRGRNGAANSDDAFHISRDDANLRVSVDIGADAPGSGPSGDTSDLPAYVTDFPFASVASITVQGFDGNDTLTVDFSGGDPLPSGGLNYQAGFGASNELIIDLAGTVQANHTGTPNGTVDFPNTDKSVTYDRVQTISAVNGSFNNGESLVAAPGVLSEGESVLLDLTFNPGTGGHMVTIDWGDGAVDSFPLDEGDTQLTGVSHSFADDAPSGTPQDDYTILVTVVDDGSTTVFDDVATVTVANESPTLGPLSLSPSTVISGGQATLGGTYSDPGTLDTHSLDLDVDGDGTFEVTDIVVSGGSFSHDITFDGPAGTHSIDVRLRDDDGGIATSSVPVTITSQPSEVLAAHVFYNDSAFDSNGGVVDVNDFAAIDPDKVPLAFGGTGSFANVSGYSRGINGLFFDVVDLPDDGAGIDASDFRFSTGNDNFPDEWDSGPAPTAVGVFPGEGADGSDRIYVTFANFAVASTWLRTTILANSDTGLGADRDFFFGSAPGETGAGISSSSVGVNSVDLFSIAQHLTPRDQLGTEPVGQPHDLDKDGSVNSRDFFVVAINVGPSVLNYITPQVGAPTASFLVIDEALAGYGDLSYATASEEQPDSGQVHVDERAGRSENTERELAFATLDDDLEIAPLQIGLPGPLARQRLAF